MGLPCVRPCGEVAYGARDALRRGFGHRVVDGRLYDATRLQRGRGSDTVGQAAGRRANGGLHDKGRVPSAGASTRSLRHPGGSGDRSNPNGRQIGLRVAIVPAVATNHQLDPLFALAGGPGDAATQFFAWLPAVFNEVHATRDIVLIDQRGTGDSNALTLPEMPNTAGLPEAQADALLSAWAHDALASIDADPRFYTTTVAADDLDAVRAALGYETINLYGTSYGGTLAQYYLRQHGQRVRVAVLDGSTPVDVPVLEWIAAHSQAALDLLFQRCANDPACHGAFPRLADEWAALMDRLATPLTVVDPESGAKAVVDQIKLAEAIHTSLLTESAAAQILLGIHLAHEQVDRGGEDHRRSTLGRSDPCHG